MSDVAREWQPIETAPKDGTAFWGDVDGDGIRMFWHEGFGEFVSSFRRMTTANGYTFADGSTEQDHSPVIHRPRYWMPAPPSASTQSSQGGE